MRTLGLRPLGALLAIVAACGGSKTPPKDGTDTTSLEADAGSTSTTDTSSADAGSGSSEDPKTSQNACTGFDLDLDKVLLQAACEVPAAPEKAVEMKGKLEVQVSAPKRIAPGAHADVTITFVNKTAGDLPLYFVVDPEPRFSVEIYDAKGTRVDQPSGDPPPLPDTVANAKPAERKAAKVVLVANGKGTVKVPFDAVKTKWAPKDKVKGAIPGQGYPKVPAGPLAKGKYIVRFVTPLTSVFEGIDHDVSQPRADVEVVP